MEVFFTALAIALTPPALMLLAAWYLVRLSDLDVAPKADRHRPRTVGYRRSGVDPKTGARVFQDPVTGHWSFGCIPIVVREFKDDPVVAAEQDAAAGELVDVRMGGVDRHVGVVLFLILMMLVAMPRECYPRGRLYEREFPRKWIRWACVADFALLAATVTFLVWRVGR